jgi:hypothetical protein
MRKAGPPAGWQWHMTGMDFKEEAIATEEMLT